VVDDDPAIARMLTRILQREGYDLTVVGSAEDAMLELADRDYDVLLTDVVLPGRAGTELAEDALRDQPRLHVVLMSGYMDDSSARVISNRHLPLLAKPFANDELLAALRG
jgi:two-component system response regulator AtoC